MKNNRTIRRKVLTALTLFWMLFIFIMSSAGSTVSDYQSDTIIDFLCTVFVEGYTEMPPVKKLELQKQGTFPVRKCAHMTEYAILGALLSLTITEYLQDSDPALKRRRDKADSQNEQSDYESQDRPGKSESQNKNSNSVSQSGQSNSESHKKHSNPATRNEQSNSESRNKHSNSASKILRRALFIGFLYACTDEFHQTFVPGRSGELRDILIDTFGVLLGALIITRILPSLIRRRTSRA